MSSEPPKTASRETRGQVLARRLRTVPVVVLAFLVTTLLLPVLLIGALVVDIVRFALARRPFMALRLTAFLWSYLLAENLGLLALLFIWVIAGFGRSRAGMERRTWRVQQVWAGFLFGAATRLLGIRVEVSGEEAVGDGPMIVLARHVSIVDNLLPSALVARARGIRLRYVLKRELLMEPCLDVAGNRLPNYFVRRGTGEAAERERLRDLAVGLSERDGVLIYPEGTRFTRERRARELARIGERDGERLRRVEAIEHLLPPKVGGFLALLEGAPGVDVVVMAHAGLDGLRRISDIWAGALVGRVVSVRFTRTARAALPSERPELVRWLDEAWVQADAWVGEQLRRTGVIGAGERAAAGVSIAGGSR